MLEIDYQNTLLEDTTVIDRTALPPERQTILAAFEKEAGRPASEEELQKIVDKNIRRGASVFCLMMAQFPLVALSVQGDHYPTAGRYTATGGGLFDPGETDARVAALRELGQEVVNDKGEPVLQNIVPEDLRPLYEKIDVSVLMPGHANPEWDIVMAEVFYTILDAAQTQSVQVHDRRLATDAVYAKASFGHTYAENGNLKGNEVGGMKIMPVAEAAQPETVALLRHGHEQQGLIELGKKRLHP